MAVDNEDSELNFLIDINGTRHYNVPLDGGIFNIIDNFYQYTKHRTDIVFPRIFYHTFIT